MTTLAPNLDQPVFDPDSPLALYEIDGAFAVAFLYEDEFCLEILSPGDTIAKCNDGLLITPDPLRPESAQCMLYQFTPFYMIRYLDADSHYSTLEKVEFEATARFIDGPAALLRTALTQAQDQLSAAQSAATRYHDALESVAYSARWGRHMPYRTIFGAMSAVHNSLQRTLGHPVDLTTPKRPRT